MRAIEIRTPGGPEVLQLVERPDPQLGAGQVLIEVQASGVNRPDVLQRKGLYPPPPGASELLGLEVAGVLARVGDADAERVLARRGLKLGDRVCALTHGGGYAERCVADAGACLPVPAHLDMSAAASLPETYFTVWANVFDRAMLKPGETLLVHGGSSGIGVAAIQMAKALGARVFVTVGTAAKAQACRALGADLAIDYRSEDFVALSRAATEGRGVDVILDMVAGDYVARDVEALAEDGRLAIIAVQGGVRAHFDASLVLRRRLTLSGSTLRPRTAAYKSDVADALLAQVWPHLAAGRIRPVIDSVLPASQVVLAHQRMEQGEHIGKIVLDWNH